MPNRLGRHAHWSLSSLSFSHLHYSTMASMIKLQSLSLSRYVRFECRSAWSSARHDWRRVLRHSRSDRRRCRRILVRIRTFPSPSRASTVNEADRWASEFFPLEWLSRRWYWVHLLLQWTTYCNVEREDGSFPREKNVVELINLECREEKDRDWTHVNAFLLFFFFFIQVALTHATERERINPVNCHFMEWNRIEDAMYSQLPSLPVDMQIDACGHPSARRYSSDQLASKTYYLRRMIRSMVFNSSHHPRSLYLRAMTSWSIFINGCVERCISLSLFALLPPSSPSSSLLRRQR